MEKEKVKKVMERLMKPFRLRSVSYTHIRAHETVVDHVCRIVLEKKNNSQENNKAVK